MTDLFDGYDNSVSPVYSQSLVVQIKFQYDHMFSVDLSKPLGWDLEAPKRFNYTLFLYFVKLVEVVEPEEKVTLVLEISEAWFDPRLAWEANSYNGINTLYVRQEKVWSPTLNSYKVNDMNDLRDQDFRIVSIDSSGRVNTTTSLRMSINCPLNVAKFPFDSQTCVMQFTMPLFPIHFVELHTELFDGIANSSAWSLMGNAEWDMINLTNRVEILAYGDYQLATFEITIRRNPMYYIYMIVLPSFIINTLSIIGVFMRKADKMSKLNVGLTNIMTMTFILGVMADKIPKTGSIPLLGIHIVVNLFITVAAVAVTVFIEKIKKVLLPRLRKRKGLWSYKLEQIIEDWLDIICMIVLETISCVNFFIIIGFWIANS
ncbi:hypothetical protein B9Z55_017863 [Caenorhabditis nigoni]|uniref:Neurotransmitter-gated ion-channel ligand-binding domain-containing protein n=2 Tax=Caenorhabditis nigoni TaxID=1611254 RepID=A0A2G5TB24_9PELO|nr:hypothetical protein B9Z55_017863 [Caenorhabditis nigoni]